MPRMSSIVSLFSVSAVLNFWFAQDCCKTLENRGKIFDLV